MSQAQLYAVDDNNKWKPIPLSAFGAASTGDGGTTTTGGATALKQDEIITLLTQLDNYFASSTNITPELQIVTTGGTVAAGAKFVSIGIRSGAGTVLGAAVDTSIAVVDFPFLGAQYQYDAIPYTVDAGGEFVIVAGR